MRYLSLAVLLFAAPALAQDEVAVRTTTALKEETPGTDKPVQLGAELATAWTRGNTETFNLSGSVRLILVPAERWVTETRARALYQESFGEVTANNWGVFQRLDRFVTGRVSIFAALGLERDPFAGLDLRSSGQLGASLLALEVRDPTREDLVTDKLQLELGFYGAYEDFILPPNAAPDAVLDERSREIYAARAAVGYVHAFSKNSQVGADFELIQDFKDTANLVINEGAWISAAITEGVALKFSLLHRFDAVPAEETLKEDDLTLTAGIVVSI